jgi:uncharacterized protein
VQLTQDAYDFRYALRGADGTSARVNERELRASFIVSPDQLIEGWGATDAAVLVPDQLAPLLALEPAVVLLGSGARLVFPPAAAQAACLARGIGLEVMDNAAAARTFNLLAMEGRRVVAGFLFPTPGAATR